MAQAKRLQGAWKWTVIVLRLLLGLIAVAAAIRLGMYIGQGLDWLVKNMASLEWLSLAAAATAGASIMVAIQALPQLVEGVIELFRSLSLALWSTFGRSLWRLAKPLFAPIVVFSFAASFTLESEPPAPKFPTPEKIAQMASEKVIEGLGGAMDNQGYTKARAELMDQLAQREIRNRYHFARFPLLFDSAKLPDEIDRANVDVNQVPFVVGTSVDESGKRFIKSLVTALGPCGSDRKVELVVEGYASSEAFRDVDEKKSRKLNVRVANARGRSVEKVIVTEIRERGWGERFDVQRLEYQSLEQMKQARQFDDRPLSGRATTVTEGPPPQDMLTRAAHIRVKHAGLCDTR